MRYRYGTIIIACVLALSIATLHTPLNFSPQTLVPIPEGASFSDAARMLASEHVVTSPFVLRVFTAFFGGATAVHAGDYLFEKPEGMLRVAWRLTHGTYGLESIRVVLPEGTTIAEMGDITAQKLPHFDVGAFERLSAGKEGYLFPDTYFFMINATPETVIATLSEHFDMVLGELEDEIASSGKSVADVVTMASILEEEAKTPEDKRIVAGILWKRLAIGMALQVDATFKYTLGKASHELTTQDLETDSPYNTYTRTGLPPTPISNPGRESLRAALEPIATEYLYYLTGNDGLMYYAKDFEGHKQNKASHL